MELKLRLLDHPFYQAWTKGEISPEQLARYHRSYAEFIGLMPQYWSKIADAFAVSGDKNVMHIINEETEHIAQWNEWVGRLPEVPEFPRMSEVIDALNGMTPSELLGAVQAFEIQQPEVAKTKKEGLLCHYGYTAPEMVYFDEHEKEEEHIICGKELADKYANAEEYKNGFEKGSELFYKGLDLFLN